MEQYENNSYNSYSILSTNLTNGNGSNKFKKISRMSSPVYIQSFGKNNFVVELKYKTNKNNNNNDDYEFIEKELKKTKKNKAYTTYTEISNEESLFFGAQKPNQRYYKDSTNFTNYIPDNITTSNNDNMYEQNYNYQLNDNEDIDSLSHPNDRIYIRKKNSNQINKSINDLRYQRFCASFLSKNPNPNSNQNSRKKTIFHKTENINNYISSNINSNEKKDRERGFSKTKNQLQDFNIDKLKEIGDNFALRYMNKKNQLSKTNLQYKQNANNINNMTILSEKKEKPNGIINKIIMFDKKRKESKNKINLINKTEIKRKPGNEYNNNDIYDNKNIYEVKQVNNNNNTNNLSTRTKILNMNKNETKVLNCPSPYTKKIKLNNIVRRKKFTLNPHNNIKLKDDFTANYYTIKDKNSTNFEKKDTTKIEQNNNKNYYPYNTKISNTNNNINYINNNLNNNIINSEKTHKIYKKVQNVNSRIIMDKNKINVNPQNNNINHNYFESINIKNNNKIKKTEHSFNNVVFPMNKK